MGVIRAVSYNFTKGKGNGIWNWGNNNGLENFGYTLGAFGNVSDIWAGLKGVYEKNADLIDKQLNTDNGIMPHSSSGEIGDISSDKQDISFGPKNHGAAFGSDGTNSYEFKTIEKWYSSHIKVHNLLKDKYYNTIDKINTGEVLGKNYSLLGRNCAMQVSRAYLNAGVFNIPLLHPVFLEVQMFARNYNYLSVFTLNQR